MLDEYKKPEMINSVDGEEAKLLFRLTDGIVAKIYTDEIPAWAKIIVG